MNKSILILIRIVFFKLLIFFLKGKTILSESNRKWILVVFHKTMLEVKVSRITDCRLSYNF